MLGAAHEPSRYASCITTLRIHKIQRVTPAMEAGISDHLWSLEEIAALFPEVGPMKRGSYTKENSCDTSVNVRLNGASILSAMAFDASPTT